MEGFRTCPPLMACSFGCCKVLIKAGGSQSFSMCGKTTSANSCSSTECAKLAVKATDTVEADGIFGIAFGVPGLGSFRAVEDQPCIEHCDRLLVRDERGIPVQ